MSPGRRAILSIHRRYEPWLRLYYFRRQKDGEPTPTRKRRCKNAGHPDFRAQGQLAAAWIEVAAADDGAVVREEIMSS